MKAYVSVRFMPKCDKSYTYSTDRVWKKGQHVRIMSLGRPAVVIIEQMVRKKPPFCTKKLIPLPGRPCIDDDYDDDLFGYNKYDDSEGYIDYENTEGGTPIEEF